MTDETILSLVKANLEIIENNTTKDSYLSTLMEAAKQEIAREGITLSDTISDGNLVAMYTAYFYRKRAEDTPVMPRMLRYALNNRLMQEKVSST